MRLRETDPATVSTGTPDLEAKAAPIVQTYSENYQEIYRRVSTTAKRCFAGNVGAYASFAVDSELYSELGYGELTPLSYQYGHAQLLRFRPCR
ncbi:hypothetical protein [Bradyrhizobium sp. BR 1432]|uniref:hypothetical protein n=1 Tax=Bradyrhizobium sp. BR 1432 TaxID=3447966 RepID=UPI003EE647EF